LLTTIAIKYVEKHFLQKHTSTEIGFGFIHKFVPIAGHMASIYTSEEVRLPFKIAQSHKIFIIAVIKIVQVASPMATKSLST